MKKTLLFALCAVMLFSLAACGSPKDEGDKDPVQSLEPSVEPSTEPSADPDSGESQKPEVSDKDPQDMSLEELMEAVYNDVADLPATQNIDVNDENYKNYLFIDPIEGAETLVSEATINAVAHSVALVRLPEGADVQAVADEIEANADPAKWVCVTAEKTIVSVHDNTILFVMSFAETADAIAANFDALWA